MLYELINKILQHEMKLEWMIITLSFVYGYELINQILQHEMKLEETK